MAKARTARRLNPQERIEALREQLEEEQRLREEAEDEAFQLRGRLSRIEGLATVETEQDEDESDECEFCEGEGCDECEE
jgi:hypothetical protein